MGDEYRAPEWVDPKFYPRDRYVNVKLGKWALWGGVFDRLWQLTNVRYLSIGDLRTVIHGGFREPHIELVRTDGPSEVSVGAWEEYFSATWRITEGPLAAAATFTSLRGDEWWKVSARYTLDSLTATLLVEHGEALGRINVASHVVLNQPKFVIIASGGWRTQAGKEVGFAVAELDWNLVRLDWSGVKDLTGQLVEPRQRFQLVPFVAVGYGIDVNLFRSALRDAMGQVGVKIRF